MNELRKILLKNRITPKWIIFLIDMLISVASFSYAYLLLSNFNILTLHLQGLTSGIATVIVLSAIFFFIFKTFEGIIRLSDFHEALRAVSPVLFTVFSITVLNILLENFTPYVPIPTTLAVLYFFSCSFAVVGYRILIRKLYAAGVSAQSKTNVLIFGAENNGSLLQKKINSNAAYSVVGFIDDNNRVINKTIDGIRIHSYKSLSSLLQKMDIKYVFFARENVDAIVKNKVVDDCFAQGANVMNVPPVESWAHSELQINQLRNVKIEELLGRPAIQWVNHSIAGYLKTKRILITGAAGSIGSELARQIASFRPECLIISDQSETGLCQLEYDLSNNIESEGFLKMFIADVKDYQAMDQLFRTYRPEIVFHAAAYKHVPVMENHPSAAINNNVLGTKVVADLSELYGVERFLLISTDKAINPTNIMGASKRIAEMYCQSLHSKDLVYQQGNLVYYQNAGSGRRTKFITTRFGNVLASNGSVIPRFQEQIIKGGPVTVTHPDVIRYFMTIPEACSLVLEAITMGNGGETFMFDMGQPVKIADLAAKMIKLGGFRPGIDIQITYTGLRPGEKLYEELLNKEDEVLPTHHEKILIAKNPLGVTGKMAFDISELLQFSSEFKDELVVRKMKNMLPGYKSNNSVYSLYDEEITVDASLKVASLL